MNYSLNNAVYFRAIKGEYLAFSSQSKETLILHFLAFEVLNVLKNRSLDFDNLVLLLLKKSKSMTEKELREFLRSTLESFCELGFVEGCEA